MEKWKGRERGRGRGRRKYKTARVQRIAVLAYVSLSKGGDDIAKREKGLVYCLGFVQGQPLGISLVHLHKKTQYATSEPKHTKVVAALCEGHDSGGLNMQKCAVHTFTSNASMQHFNDTTLTKKGKKTEDKEFHKQFEVPKPILPPPNHMDLCYATFSDPARSTR